MEVRGREPRCGWGSGSSTLSLCVYPGGSLAHFLAWRPWHGRLGPAPPPSRNDPLFPLVGCCTEGIFSHRWSKGTLCNKQVGANLAQVSRLLGVELMALGTFSEERGSALRRRQLERRAVTELAASCAH